MVGNLGDPDFCARIVRGVHTILHFAATMGGMGTIHSRNDFIIYKDNHAMTLNLLSAAVKAGVTRFLYASSACVYPDSLQSHELVDVELKEEDVWTNPPPEPQGLYGLEKLNSELLLHQFRKQIELSVARFHNVYGPGGAWRNGREKAPAAMLRKALALSLLGQSSGTMEIWGDGTQRRSFLWIEDCVDAVVLLLNSPFSGPVNIGSSRSVSIDELARIALRVAGIPNVELGHIQGPLGVASRNSNNNLVEQKLDWHPQTSLEDGMMITYKWMRCELERLISSLDAYKRSTVLERLLRSDLVDLQSERTIFAILLPITSRGSKSPGDCLHGLTSFADSLLKTTWRDRHEHGALFDFKIYLALDEDDEFLLASDGDTNKAEMLLRRAGITDVFTLICDYPRGHVCSLWRRCAQQAWKDGCEYFTLMGDDVTLQDEGWMRDIHATFGKIATSQNLPQGFGCVAFTDTTFPGMPTFPVVSRTHMDIFEGVVVPDTFVNQDGDPYLYQLYRRWGASFMHPSRIRNGCGGNGPARYNKQYTSDWTFGPLENGTTSVESWLEGRTGCTTSQRKLTLDVVIPCYRVQMSFLDSILQLHSSDTCSVMFIIIIDNPLSPHISELLRKYEHRPDVRIRINPKNLGASASRNRGMEESAAEWIHFLDDDIIPRTDVLFEAENVIRAHPSAAGFIGNAYFPPADTVFKTAAHLAGVTYFWDIADKIEDDLPWGVTANIIARRNVPDNVKYDLIFPKTGGGEDIDFCRKKRQYSLEHGGEGFRAAPKVVVTHPWWHDGQRSYKRFYMWSVGDGALVKMFPEYTYRDLTPNSAEILLFSAFLLVTGSGIWLLFQRCTIILFAVKLFIATLLANIFHDLYRHLWRDISKTRAIKSTLSGMWWVPAVVESTLVRIASEMGRVIGMLERREFTYLGMRFDWFTGRAGNGPRNEEKKNNLQRFGIIVVFLGYLCIVHE